MKNSKSTQSNTGYKGIYFKKSVGLFIAQLTYRNKSGINIAYWIGQYETLKEAIKSREDFIKSLF